MRQLIRAAILCIPTVLITPLAYSSCDFSRYVGYSIIYSGTVTGYIDSDGKQKDSFEGCEHDRVLIVDYNKQVVCSTYSYSYSYRPDIVILKQGYSAIAIIDGEKYDISL